MRGLLLVLVAGLAGVLTPPRALYVEDIVLSPDTLALGYGDQGLITGSCLNQYGDEVFCAGGVHWTIRDTAKVLPITTTANEAMVIPKLTGTTWVVASAGSGRGLDSTKIVVLVGPPAPITPTPPESVFVALSPDTVRIDSGSTGLVTAQTYQNAARTILTTLRTVGASSTNPAVATVSPSTGSSTLTLTVAGVRSGSAQVIASPVYPGRRDTTVVIVRSVVDTTIPPDTTTTPLVNCPSGVPAILVGENWQTRINAYPSGAKFCARAGIHRYATALPKTNDTIIGETGAILTGARVLTGWTASGAHWYVSGQTQQNTAYTTVTCESGHPGCNLPEQLWVNDSLYEHMTTLAAVTAGSRRWYFDYSADRVYLGVNPSGKTIETSVTPYAIGGTATGVVLKHLTITRYATGNQRGTVGNTGGSGWTVDSNDIAQSHGTGIKLSGTSPRVRGNLIREHGQLGLAMTNTTNAQVKGNEIRDNATAFFAISGADAQAGALKLTGGSNLLFRNNWSHHNRGSGVWTDVNPINTTIDSNLVEWNEGRGIEVEVSYGAIIRGNLVRRNGLVLPQTDVTRAGIWVSSSPDVEIVGNTVDSNFAGITAMDNARSTPIPPAGYGPHVVENLSVHGNIVRQPSGHAAGVQDLHPSHDPYTAAANNVWATNTYTLDAATKFRWTGNTDKTWAQWRSAGQDAGSTQTGQ